MGRINKVQFVARMDNADVAFILYHKGKNFDWDSFKTCFEWSLDDPKNADIKYEHKRVTKATGYNIVFDNASVLSINYEYGVEKKFYELQHNDETYLFCVYINKDEYDPEGNNAYKVMAYRKF